MYWDIYLSGVMYVCDDVLSYVICFIYCLRHPLWGVFLLYYGLLVIIFMYFLVLLYGLYLFICKNIIPAAFLSYWFNLFLNNRKDIPRRSIAVFLCMLLTGIYFVEFFMWLFERIKNEIIYEWSNHLFYLRRADWPYWLSWLIRGSVISNNQAGYILFTL